MVSFLADEAVLTPPKTPTTTRPTAPVAEESPELKRRRSLFSISGDMLALDDLLDEIGGELPDEETGAAIDAWFAELDKERDRKVDGYVALIKECEARSRARAARAKEIAELARVDENKAKYLKRRLHEFMSLHQIRKLDTDNSRLSICANGGKLPLILKQGVRPEDVPESMRRIEVTIDNDKVRDAIEKGVELDFAMLGERGEHLRIK